MLPHYTGLTFNCTDSLVKDSYLFWTWFQVLFSSSQPFSNTTELCTQSAPSLGPGILTGTTPWHTQKRLNITVPLDSGMCFIILFQYFFLYSNSIALSSLLFFHCPPTHTLLAKLSPRLPSLVISHPLPSLLHL